MKESEMFRANRILEANIKKMGAKITNYLELKDALIEVIRYLDTEAFLKENACYGKPEIKKYLGEVVKDAIKEYYSK